LLHFVKFQLNQRTIGVKPHFLPLLNNMGAKVHKTK
jgi:hypothetical protein